MTTWGLKVSQWINGRRSNLNKKASAAGSPLGGRPQSAFLSFSAPRWTGRSCAKLVREGREE